MVAINNMKIDQQKLHDIQASLARMKSSESLITAVDETSIVALEKIPTLNYLG